MAERGSYAAANNQAKMEMLEGGANVLEFNADIDGFDDDDEDGDDDDNGGDKTSWKASTSHGHRSGSSKAVNVGSAFDSSGHEGGRSGSGVGAPTAEVTGRMNMAYDNSICRLYILLHNMEDIFPLLQESSAAACPGVEHQMGE